MTRPILVFAMLLCGCGRRGEIPMDSYMAHYANSLRGSRVAVSSRSFERLERKATFSEAQHMGDDFVLVDRSARHVILQRGASVDLFDANGTRKELYMTSSARSHTLVTLTEDTFLVDDVATQKLGGGLLSWGFDPAPLDTTFYATSLTETTWMSVKQIERSRAHPEPFLMLLSKRVVSSSATHRTAEPHWQKIVPGEGIGAIGADGVIAYAMRSGTFGLTTPGDSALGPNGRVVEKSLGYPVTDLSIRSTGEDFWVVSRAGSECVLHTLDARGDEKWSAAAAVVAAEPPVDGGDGRVYLAGDGLVAIENGRVVWSSPSRARHRVTSFEDGTLAVAVGGELRIVHRDGTIRQRFPVQGGEEISAPPAIASDGAVWVATATSLYVLR